jgi:hypothetical protein
VTASQLAHLVLALDPDRRRTSPDQKNASKHQRDDGRKIGNGDAERLDA